MNTIELKRFQKKRTALRFAQDIRQICRPLLHHTPIQYFCVTINFDDGSYNALNSDLNWGTICIKNKFYRVGINRYLTENITANHMLWTPEIIAGTKNRLTHDFIRANHEFGFHSGSIHFERNQNYTLIYYFLSELPVAQMNHYVVENMSKLQAFIIYFKEQLYANAKMYNSFFIENRYIEDLYKPVTSNLSAYDFNLQLNKIFLGTSEQNYLTRREVLCLSLALCFLSNKEISEILSCSQKTVEKHLENAKSKAGFENLRDLKQYCMRSEYLPYLMSVADSKRFPSTSNLLNKEASI